MRTLKLLLGVFIISFIFMASGVAADWTTLTYNTPLLANKGVTYEGTLEKLDVQSPTPQVLTISYDTENRKFQFKVNDDVNNSTSWFTIEPTGADTFAHYRGNCSASGNDNYILCYMGTKTLYMRTDYSYNNSTNIIGTWWVSSNEFNDCRAQGIWYCQ